MSPDFPEAGFSRQGSYSHLTRGHVLPLSVLLGLLFPGTHFEKVCLIGTTGGLGSSYDSVPNSLCAPGPVIFLLPSPSVLHESPAPLC